MRLATAMGEKSLIAGIIAGKERNEEMENEYAMQNNLKGIVPEEIIFRCRKCGEVCVTLSESELSKYQRTWELLENKPLTDAQIAEFVDLCERGYRYIGVFCPNEKCDGEFDTVIMSEQEWKECAEYAEIIYEISDNP